eukprot:COSAG02_NODE_19219_length_894_cov_1.091824_1_plen_91_part_00
MQRATARPVLNKNTQTKITIDGGPCREPLVELLGDEAAVERLLASVGPPPSDDLESVEPLSVSEAQAKWELATDAAAAAANGAAHHSQYE